MILRRQQIFLQRKKGVKSVSLATGCLETAGGSELYEEVWPGSDSQSRRMKDDIK